jgi:hypothetical protein
MAADLVKEFVVEFNAEIERNRASAKARSDTHARRLGDVDRKIASIVKAVEDGMYHPAMKERLDQLQADRFTLVAAAPTIEPSNVDVLMHPNVPELYRRKVGELQQMLETGKERDEARNLVRSMIDKVVLTPRAKANGLDATLYGELAAILALCGAAAKNSGKSEASQLSVVAGTRNPRELTLSFCI